MKIYFIILSLLLLSAQGGFPSQGFLKGDTTSRFFVIGDFGDVKTFSDLDHVTTLMDDFAAQKKYEYILTVGDNVYENGIESMSDLKHVNKIMSAFKKPALKDVPMYLTLGNHDCYSDYKNEIEYHKVDSQWNMESDYYKLKLPLKDDPSRSFVLLMSNSCLLSCLSTFGDDPNSPSDCDQMNVKVGGNRVKAHFEWMEDQLKKISSDPSVAWSAVVMHHSLFIIPSMKQDLLPLLWKYKVDMAIVGHNHQFEYANIGYDEEIRFPGKKHGHAIDKCQGKKEIINTPTRYQVFKKGEVFHQFMIGGSGRVFADICPYYDQDGKVYFQNIQEHGMMTVEVDSKHFSAKFYEKEDAVVYQVDINA